MGVLHVTRPMRYGLFILVLLSVGCAGSGPSLTNDFADPHQETCHSRQQRPDRARSHSAECRSQHVWWGEVGDALSGAAMAVRLPKP